MNKGKAEPVPYPKKPLNGYFTFAMEQRAKGKSPKEIKSGWGELSQAQKDKLNDNWKVEMVEFNKEKEAWEKKYGEKPSKKERKEQNEVSKAEKEKGAMDGNKRGKKIEENPKEKSEGKSKEKRAASKGNAKSKK